MTGIPHKRGKKHTHTHKDPVDAFQQKKVR